MVGDREHAEDLAQDTLIKAYEAMEWRRAGQEFSSGWLLRTVVGLSNGEITAALGISARTVNTLLFRARERFRAVHRQLEGIPATARSAAERVPLDPATPQPAQGGTGMHDDL